MYHARPVASPGEFDRRPSLLSSSAASADTMTTSSLTIESSSPRLALSPSPPTIAGSPPPFPASVQTLRYAESTQPRQKPQPPPPINTTAGWPLASRTPTPEGSSREFRELWNGASRSPRPRAGTTAGSDTGRSFLGANLFKTISGGSRSSSESGHEGLRRSQTDPLPPLTPDDIIIPAFAREHSITDAGSLPPTPRLRTSTAIPDHRKLRYAHPESAKGRFRTGSPSAVGVAIPSPSMAIPTYSPLTNSPSPLSAQDRHMPTHILPAQMPARESVYTTASSKYESSGLDRSSTITSMTSTSDAWNSTSLFQSRIMQEDISVDDYISLYADGFEDDPPDEKDRSSPLKSSGMQQPLQPLQTWHEDVPPVPKIDSAKFHLPSKPLPHTPAPPVPPPKGNSTVLDAVLPEAPEEHEREPAVYVDPEPDPNADRYGFKKDTRYISLDDYEIWNEQYEEYLSRRRAKWEDLLHSHRLSPYDPQIFPPRSDKIKRFIRKGIPPEWRGAAWFWYAGGPARLEQYRGLYEHLLERIEQYGQLGEGDREHIERDLNRTFPDNDQFKRCVRMSVPANKFRPVSEAPSIYSDHPEEAPDRPMIQSLRRVLQCFAVYQPKIGYCQSLNFLAGQLLLFLHGNEEKAFHLLCILTAEHLPGTHGVALEGANVDISVLMTTLKDQMPAMWAKLEDSTDTPATGRSPIMTKDAGPPRLPTVSLATTPWFMSCFVGSLPVETCCRVWDVLFYEGSKTLFRVALGIFKLGEDEIRNVSDPMEVFQIVQSLPRQMLDSNALMEVSFGRGMEGRGLLSQDTVRRRREEKREVYQRQRTNTGLSRTPTTTSVATSNADASESSEGLKRSLSRGASIKKLARLKSLGRKKAPPLPSPLP